MLKKKKKKRPGRSSPAPAIIMRDHRESEQIVDVTAPFPIDPALIPLPLGSTVNKTSPAQAVHGQLLWRIKMQLWRFPWAHLGLCHHVNNTAEPQTGRWLLPPPPCSSQEPPWASVSPAVTPGELRTLFLPVSPADLPDPL